MTSNQNPAFYQNDKSCEENSSNSKHNNDMYYAKLYEAALGGVSNIYALEQRYENDSIPSFSSNERSNSIKFYKDTSNNKSGHCHTTFSEDKVASSAKNGLFISHLKTVSNSEIDKINRSMGYSEEEQNNEGKHRRNPHQTKNKKKSLQRGTSKEKKPPQSKKSCPKTNFRTCNQYDAGNSNPKTSKYEADAIYLLSKLNRESEKKIKAYEIKMDKLYQFGQNWKKVAEEGKDLSDTNARLSNKIESLERNLLILQKEKATAEVENAELKECLRKTEESKKLVEEDLIKTSEDLKK